jgi:hypothetical protein
MSQPKIDRDWDLSRAEFADAIAKGLGRAFVYVNNYGLDRVACQGSWMAFESTEASIDKYC